MNLWLATSASAQQAVAISGVPFGVGYIRVTWPQAVTPDAMVNIQSTNGRIFYPCYNPITVTQREPMELNLAPGEMKFGRGRLLDRIGQVVKAVVTTEETEYAVGHEIWFLFQGDQPFEVQISGPASATIAMNPLLTPASELQTAYEAWWTPYQKQSEEIIDAGEFMPVTQTYLLGSLAQRLRLARAPILDRMQFGKVPHLLQQATDGSWVERIALASVWQADELRSDTPQQMTPIVQPLAQVPKLDDDQGPENIEDLARYVPPECFYLRFGSFKNMLWYQGLTHDYGGDLQNMVLSPTLDIQQSARIERLLNVHYSQVANLLGDQIIEDMCIIGTDLLMGDGPSMGIMFSAKNAFLLSASFNSDRKTAAANISGCTLEDVKIDGVDVSLLSTPDNRIRSYMVANGNKFLLTSSRHLAERCIRARKARQTLAATEAFQQFRDLRGGNGADTITAYVPQRFFNELLTPNFQIELLRRNMSRAEIATLQAARYCAANEGNALKSIEDLVQHGYLPPKFGQRTDHSRLVLDNHLGIVDSMRGTPGSMLPIADISTQEMSAAESRYFERVIQAQQSAPGQTDPLFVTVQVKRSADKDGADQLHVTADLPPALLGKHAWLAHELGPASDIGVRFASNDLLTFHANVTTQQLGGTIPQHYLFGAIKDCHPAEIQQFRSKLHSLFALETIRGYLGAWPNPGLIDRLPLRLGRGTQLGPNLTRLVGGIYRYYSDRVSLLTFDRSVLHESVPELAVLDQQPMCCARVELKDLAGTQLSRWINETMLELQYEQSALGIGLLNRYTDQLGVPAGQAAHAATLLQHGRPVCGLGGNFVLDANSRWTSDLSNLPGTPVPPLMRWLGPAAVKVDSLFPRMVASIDLSIKRDNPPPRRSHQATHHEPKQPAAANANSNEGKPNEGKPNEGKPNEGKPSEGKPEVIAKPEPIPKPAPNPDPDVNKSQPATGGLPRASL